MDGKERGGGRSRPPPGGRALLRRRGGSLGAPAEGRGPAEGSRAASTHLFRSPAPPPNSAPARPAKSHGPTGSPAAILPGNNLRRAPPFFATWPLFFLGLLVSCLLLLADSAEGRPSEYYYGAPESQKNWRITCYTCVNVSNNDECNRYAIDRPCPEGGDYCLTLHVMDATDRERSVLVNKRCASMEDCTGDATGCTTAYGQTQCVSCCDQAYCNDSVPSNSTNAVFYRSAARASVAAAGRRRWEDVAWRLAALLIPTIKVLTFGGPS